MKAIRWIMVGLLCLLTELAIIALCGEPMEVVSFGNFILVKISALGVIWLCYRGVMKLYHSHQLPKCISDSLDEPEDVEF